VRVLIPKRLTLKKVTIFFLLRGRSIRKKSEVLKGSALKSGNESSAIDQTYPKIVFGKFQGSARSMKLTAGIASTSGAGAARTTIGTTRSAAGAASSAGTAAAA
jgi:hypothetical protein